MRPHPHEIPRPLDVAAVAEMHRVYGPLPTHCASGSCWHSPPRPIGFHVDDDGEVAWGFMWRLPDGRLVCEDCAIAWDEGVLS